MSSLVTKTNYQRAITVIQSDTVEIPCPWLRVMTGTSTSVGGGPGAPNLGLIQVSGINFYSMNIKAGDIIINKTASPNTIAYVTAIPQADALYLSANIFSVAASNFELYISQGNAGVTYDAPVIYNPTAGNNYSVLTAGNDTVTFNSVPIGVLPVQVSRVNVTGSTASTTLIALW